MDFLITPFAWVMKAGMYIFKNYGLALCFYALITKLVLFPLMMKQQKNQLNMVRMRPHMAELQKRYGDNKIKYNEELQKLYQREGYNPMSSCLPMLIQLPLIFIIYSIVRRPLTYGAGLDPKGIYELAEKAVGALEAAGEKVSETLAKTMTAIGETISKGAADYSAITNVEDQVFNAASNADIDTGLRGGTFFGLFSLSDIPSEAMGWTLLIPIAAGLTGFLVSWLSQKTSAMTQDPSMQGGCSGKTMMYVMPLITVFFCFSVNGALGLYWIVGNILGIAQHFILHKMYDPAKVLAEEEAKIAKAREQKRAKRSAAAAKKAAAIEATQKKKK
ncbi:MAG: membrane protein insertase YidC [Clostridia bacterium]|nr:membrane protein insertase YidC [Clostridia bacterium]